MRYNIYMKVYFERIKNMTLTIRKIIISAIVAMIFMAANIVVIANWLADTGVEQKASYVKEQFLTGTALTIIFALLILLVSPRNGKTARFSRTCPVCDERLSGNVKYCSECGSRI